MIKKILISCLCGTLIGSLVMYGINHNAQTDKEVTYKFDKAVEVLGRQGIASEGDYYWVTGSTGIYKYDKDWNLISKNEDPFNGYTLEVNHFGDLDVYNNELYLGAEYFMDGIGTNIQVAVYDGDTLELKRTFPFVQESGQLECSGICVNPDDGVVVMTSWVGEESGRYLYQYDLSTGEYLGKVHMQPVPQWLQGIAYFNGKYYMSADDGTADENESDHIYTTEIVYGQSWCKVEQVYTLNDVVMQGEIEGISFDKTKNQMLVLYNHGSRIVLGMVKGFYPGYDHEISEIYSFDIKSK